MITNNVPGFRWPGPGFASGLNLLIPSPPWSYKTKGHGGGDVSDAGVPEVFEQRRDELVDIVLRFRETDWASVRAFVIAAQQGVLVRWLPDYYVTPGTYHDGYLESPAIDQEFGYEREEYPGILRASIKLRVTSGAPGTQYFATPAV